MNNQELSYRLAKDCEEDFEDLYKIKCDPVNIQWGGFRCAPEKESFYEWYKKRLKDTDREIYLVYLDNLIVGFFYIDYLDEDTIEDTSGILTEYSGRGIGTYIIESIDNIAKQKGKKKHIAWISENNISSYKRYIKLGYQKTEETDQRDLPLLGGMQTFYKWVKYY